MEYSQENNEKQLLFEYFSILFASGNIDQVVKEWYASQYLGDSGEIRRDMILYFVEHSAWKYGLDSKVSFREYVQAYDEKIYKEAGFNDPTEALTYFIEKNDKARMLVALRKGAVVSQNYILKLLEEGNNKFGLFFVDKYKLYSYHLFRRSLVYGNFGAVRHFIENGVELKGDEMIVAVSLENFGIMGYLISKDSTMANKGLRLAAARGNLKVVNYLVKKGASNLREAFTIALSEDRQEVVEYLAKLT